MLILSWNVAGWSRSLKHIREKHESLASWISQHGCDILALQEVKVKKEVIRDSPNTVDAELAGWDTFWCPCQLKGNLSGFNGVAVFAKKGLTIRADCAPFGEQELDDEGRCIMTEHAGLVLFNVYVPNDSKGSSRLPFKMRFLEALEARMERARRESAKPVMLVGDLNIARRPQDNYVMDRLVHVESILSSPPPPGLGGLWTDLTRVWPDVVKMLEGRRWQKQATYAPSQANRALQRWRVYVEGLEGREVMLKKTFDSEGEAMGDNDNYSLAARHVGGWTAREGGEIRVGELAECVKAMGGVEWSEGQMRAVSDAVGRSKSSPPCREWFERIIVGGMADAFAELWGSARARFTCWDQYKNKRYTNEGARIDYTLVDRSLFDQHVIPGVSCLYGGAETEHAAEGKAEGIGSTTVQNAEGGGGEEGGRGGCEMSALRACTAYGRWKMAPFDGSGMQEGTGDDYQTQFAAAHSGMVYTPPQFSDHIGVSLLLAPSFATTPVALSSDEATRKSMPHAQQHKISSFFSKGPAVTAAAPPPPTPPSQNEPGIAAFFSDAATAEDAFASLGCSRASAGGIKRSSGSAPGKQPAKKAATTKGKGKGKADVGTPRIASFFGKPENSRKDGQE